MQGIRLLFLLYPTSDCKSKIEQQIAESSLKKLQCNPRTEKQKKVSLCINK